MDRRAFFSQGTKKVAEGATKLLEKKLKKDAAHWIRPPFAVDEVNFLLACTRCDACITACPYHVIFPLSARLGAYISSTPAMDLLNKSCQLCDDFPCVSVCETNALLIPESTPKLEKKKNKNKTEKNRNKEEEKNKANKKKKKPKNKSKKQKNKKQWPKIAKVFINSMTCLAYSGPECGACRVCPVPNAMIWDREKPIIDASLCTGCAQCRDACIIEPKAIVVQSLYKDQ